MKIALAQINPLVGDFSSNKQKIIDFHHKALAQGAELTLFPELAICGYPPEDLLLYSHFIDEMQASTHEICTKCPKGALIIGLARRNLKRGKPLFNSAVLIENGKVKGFQDKQLLPEYDVFFERRYFEPGKEYQIFEIGKKRVLITLCEDIWGAAYLGDLYTHDPLEITFEKPIDLVVNLSSSPFSIGRFEERIQIGKTLTKRFQAPFFYCNQVGGNDSLIFDGRSFGLSASGDLLGVGAAFQQELLVLDTTSKVYSLKNSFSKIELVHDALVLGVQDYFSKQRFKKAVLGLSGGIDSAVVACLAVKALGAENVRALALPSRFSSKESIEDAKALAKNLKCHFSQISIESTFKLLEKELEEPFPNRDFGVMEENLQARIRGILLMAFSNQTGEIVLNCANKSESAVGYTTLYGDLCGGLSVIGDVSKSLVYELAQWINKKKSWIPQRILEKKPSAELRPDQFDEQTLPPYSLIDRVIELYIEEHLDPQKICEKEKLPIEEVMRVIHMIHKNEYKRRQGPLSLRVTGRAFSSGRRLPIVQKWDQNI